MSGLSRHDATLVDGFGHVVQSIEDILTTQIGSRVMLRTYGSVCPALIDAPMASRNLLRWYVAAADALDRWEPRYGLEAVAVEPIDPSLHAHGRIALGLGGVWYPFGHLGDRRTVRPAPPVKLILR